MMLGHLPAQSGPRCRQLAAQSLAGQVGQALLPSDQGTDLPEELTQQEAVVLGDPPAQRQPQLGDLAAQPG